MKVGGETHSAHRHVQDGDQRDGMGRDGMGQPAVQEAGAPIDKHFAPRGLWMDISLLFIGINLVFKFAG